MPTMKVKFWLSVAAVFASGALAVNAVWVHFYNVVDLRHVNQINELVTLYDSRMETLERSHKRELGKMRNRVEKKIDRVLSLMETLPPTPTIQRTREELEKVKDE